MTNKNTQEIKHKFYSESGVVIGQYVDVSAGLRYVKTRNFTADSEKELKAKIQKAFDLGTLDENCRFNKLLAAGVVLVDEASVEIDGKVFTNIIKTNFIIGDVVLFNKKIAEGYIIDENAVEE